jgi:3-oxoacyl-[acyl-carrier protein] reductase
MRNVIVTGASRGLGLAIAGSLVTAGYQVIAVARSESVELQDLAASLEHKATGSIHFRPFDLNAIGEIGSFVGAVRKQYGPIFGLVNNAGIGTAGLLSMMRDVQIDALTRLNVVSPITMTKYVVRSMMVEKAGRIVNMSSIVASTGYAGLSVYAATKAALLGFTRSLAREVGHFGITVNAIAPGFVTTQMTQDLSQAQREQIARRSALKRLADPSDIAAGVEFLLGDKGRNVTGTTLTIDAGNTA